MNKDKLETWIAYQSFHQKKHERFLFQVEKDSQYFHSLPPDALDRDTALYRLGRSQRRQQRHEELLKWMKKELNLLQHKMTSDQIQVRQGGSDTVGPGTQTQRLRKRARYNERDDAQIVSEPQSKKAKTVNQNFTANAEITHTPAKSSPNSSLPRRSKRARKPPNADFPIYHS
ncbi:MAG: hypothetical protein GOMPHAMPRED_001071 [Gomphillus americanus]|uniref:Uncharacterized protein n=1 Tax=Gomphillus americanus TaxID=1940652 RepID=A0A8H3F6U5_9LECA|nr:MAG: hypothetical protein GOMPHAMPRED_001071 [Gomphillus americanus]